MKLNKLFLRQVLSGSSKLAAGLRTNSSLIQKKSGTKSQM